MIATFGARETLHVDTSVCQATFLQDERGTVIDSDSAQKNSNLPHSMARTLREVHEAISQVLFSLNLTVEAAQRAAVDDPDHLQQLLSLIREQTDVGLELMRRLRPDS